MRGPASACGATLWYERKPRAATLALRDYSRVQASLPFNTRTLYSLSQLQLPPHVNLKLR